MSYTYTGGVYPPPVFPPPPAPIPSAPPIPTAQQRANAVCRVAIQIISATAMAVGIAGLAIAIAVESPALLVTSLVISIAAMIALEASSPHSMFVPFHLSHGFCAPLYFRHHNYWGHHHWGGAPWHRHRW